MSKAFIFVFLCVLTLNAVEWKTYKEALEIQAKNNKPIMIDVIRTYCSYCSNMEKDVFDDHDMSIWIEKRFIPVKINLDTDIVPLGLKVSFTPSFFFVDKQGNILKKIPGSWNIEDFKSITKDIK